MRNRTRLTFAAALLALVFAPQALAAPASVAKPAPAATKPAATITQGHVYLIRGLGNFLSRGIDTFKSEFDALGVPNTIFNHTRYSEITDQVIASYRKDKNLAPIIIIGHSFGANAAVRMANRLGASGVPVRLLVTFDSVWDNPELGSGNAAEVIDYYKPEFGRAARLAAGFKGPVASTNLAGHADITHDSIDKNAAFHKVVVARVLAILKVKPKV
jgi:thioesterase domain-containing protein